MYLLQISFPNNFNNRCFFLIFSSLYFEVNTFVMKTCLFASLNFYVPPSVHFVHWFFMVMGCVGPHNRPRFVQRQPSRAAPAHLSGATVIPTFRRPEMWKGIPLVNKQRSSICCYKLVIPSYNKSKIHCLTTCWADRKIKCRQVAKFWTTSKTLEFEVDN